MPPKISGPSPKIWGAKNTKCWTTFAATSALDTVYLRKETSHRQTKMLMSVYTVCPLNVDLLSVTVDPETAEIRSVIVTHLSAIITLQPSKLRHV